MMFPTVHMNGTSARDLLEDVCKASSALQTALERMQAAAPNGRDYYPQGGTAFFAAQDEHYVRLQKVQGVRAELEQLAEYLADRVVAK